MSIEYSLSSKQLSTCEEQLIDNPLSQYLKTLRKLPNYSHYKSYVQRGKKLTLQQMITHSQKQYHTFANQRWTESNKAIFLCLILVICEQQEISPDSKMELHVWDHLANLLNSTTNILIRKWIPILKCKNGDWTEKEEIILSDLAAKSTNWIDISLKIYLESGAFILRNQRSAETKWRQMKGQKYNEKWTSEEDSLICILFYLNSFAFSASQKLVNGRQSKQINNRFRFLTQQGHLNDQVIENLMYNMIRLSTNLKSCSEIIPTRIESHESFAVTESVFDASHHMLSMEI